MALHLTDSTGSWDEEALCRSKDIQIELSEQFNNPYELKESLQKTQARDKERLFGGGSGGKGKQASGTTAWLKQKIEDIVQNIRISVRNVHIRIETNRSGPGPPPSTAPDEQLCNAIGLVLPSLSCVPGSASGKRSEIRHYSQPVLSTDHANRVQTS